MPGDRRNEYAVRRSKTSKLSYVNSQSLVLCFDFTSFPVFLFLVHSGFLFLLCGNLRTGGDLSFFLCFVNLSRTGDFSCVLADLSKAGL